MSAMRSSIDEQIYLFRKENEQRCVFCDSVNELQVDHEIHFDTIATNFIDSVGIENIPKTFGNTDDGTNRKCFLEIDDNFKNEWTDYHRKHATLRMLCKKCNLTRPNAPRKNIFFG